MLTACYSARRLEVIKRDGIAPKLSTADYYKPELIRPDSLVRDTMKVRNSEGKELLIMRAVRDEDGTMVATEQLNASIVVSTFRNVAERHGKVDLRFRIAVPPSMIDSEWQLRIVPDLYIMGDTLSLAPVIISGVKFRESQISGRDAYRRYLESIVNDPSAFTRERELAIFLLRNYNLEIALSEAEEHYSWHLLRSINEMRKRQAPAVYRRLVKAPLETDGFRLDTVIVRTDGYFEYEYLHTVRTRPGLRKAEVSLRTSVRDLQNRMISLEDSLKVSFYISSLSTLVHNTTKYKTEIISRRVSDNSVCWIEFQCGKSNLDPELGHNVSEMKRIEDAMVQLLGNEKYDMDSIVVTAFSSPEGSLASNRKLSQKRSEAVCRYYDEFARRWRDSVRTEEGVKMTLEGRKVDTPLPPLFSFLSRSVPENWGMLEKMVRNDEELPMSEKNSVLESFSISDLDLRERRISELPCYKYLREKVYPSLRIVSFNFFLHLKGMVQDTVHTTVVDMNYMDGLAAIRERDYSRALFLLNPYHDYNTAVACVALDRNATALDILEKLPSDASRNYLLALVYSRMGRDRDAVQSYLDACSEDASYIHRGNLDPEIATLTHKYSINYEN